MYRPIFFKSLLVGVAIFGMAGSAFAYSATGDATYPSNSDYAQTTMPANSGTNGSAMITNPQLIGSCLCLESNYQALGNDVSAKQAAYNQAVSERATLDSQLASEKGSSPATPDQLNAIRTTSERRISLQGQINDKLIPQLQNATNQYNAAVGQYQQSCAGKAFDATVTAQIQSNLQCRG